jgi:uroporphyrinogen-III decarboxylase
MKECYEGKLTFLGRPVGPFDHGVGIYGFFSVALDLRGPQLMSDMYDDPEFARVFLLKIASWCDVLERTWTGLNGNEVGAYSASDHGIDMLSPDQYERFIVPAVHEMNRRRGTQPSGGLHHCGRGSHLFPVIQRHFGLKRIHALTHPIVDIARVRRELGDEVWLECCLYDPIVQFGPPERIRQAVKDLLTSGAKGKGRFALIAGDMLKGTPLEHRIAFYESIKEFGAY